MLRKEWSNRCVNLYAYDKGIGLPNPWVLEEGGQRRERALLDRPDLFSAVSADQLRNARTPHFILLTEHPVMLPKLPNPIRACTSLTGTVIPALYGGQHGRAHFVFRRDIQRQRGRAERRVLGSFLWRLYSGCAYGNDQTGLPFVMTVEVRTNLKFELLVSQHRRFIQYLECMRARVLARSFSRHNGLVTFDEFA